MSSTGFRASTEFWTRDLHRYVSDQISKQSKRTLASQLKHFTNIIVGRLVSHFDPTKHFKSIFTELLRRLYLCQGPGFLIKNNIQPSLPLR